MHQISDLVLQITADVFHASQRILSYPESNAACLKLTITMPLTFFLRFYKEIQIN